MKDIAKLIYEGLNGNIESTLLLIADKLGKEKTEKMGITRTPLLNSIGRELGKLLEREEFEKLAILWRNGKRDEKIIVIGALGVISKKDYENAKIFVNQILKDIKNWEICDQLALKVIVNLAIQNPKEMFSIMEKWVKSENKWLRRLAVATIPSYIRARKTEARKCLDFLNEVMEEEDKDVKKAVGWALREISKKDGKAVYEFLKKWIKSGNRNTQWIIKEGMKKLNKEQKDGLNAIMGIKW